MNRLPLIALRTISFQRSLALQRTEFVFRCENNQRTNKLYDLRTFNSFNNLQQQQKSPSLEKTTAASNEKKKPKTSPKITLIAQNQSITVTTLEEAQKLAKRRGLHLLLVQELDTKTQRPEYKLVTQAEMLDEELKDLKAEEKSAAGKTAAKKTEKTLTIGSRITEHDLSSRQKNICKWLAKKCEVHILIQGGADDMPKMEAIFKAIERSIKEPEVVGKIQQKRSKGSHIKFNIVPIAAAAANHGENVAQTVKTTPKAA